jgi:hypothetical protein
LRFQAPPINADPPRFLGPPQRMIIPPRTRSRMEIAAACVAGTGRRTILRGWRGRGDDGDRRGRELASDADNEYMMNDAFKEAHNVRQIIDHVHTSVRASTLDTCIAVHVLPRAVGMPRVLSVSAMECNDGAPCL